MTKGRESGSDEMRAEMVTEEGEAGSKWTKIWRAVFTYIP